jgi:hypothetical protein
MVTGRSIEYKKNIDLTEMFLGGKNTSQICQEQDLDKKNVVMNRWLQ